MTDTPQFSQRDVSPHQSSKQKQISTLRKLFRTVALPAKTIRAGKLSLTLSTIIIGLAGVFIAYITYTSYLYLSHFQIGDIAQFFSSEIPTDDQGRSNFLLLGAGGGDHDGADLTDTIIIASLHQEKKSLSLVSLPRDLWVSLPGYGSSRINKVYDNLKPQYGSEAALDILKEGVERIVGVDIPYYVKVDFSGFTRFIDTIGGVEVVVEKRIVDTAYPDSEQKGYETFILDAGKQTLDGKTALKYARSRHSSSDFDRSARQQQIIAAIKNRLEPSRLATSPLMLKQLYDDFTEHIETNLSITQMVSLARFGKDIERNNIVSHVIRDNDVILNEAGTFLYTPERRFYGGAFVLVPEGNSFKNIQTFVNLLFSYPDFYSKKPKVQVFNGTKKSGIAGEVWSKLTQFGFNVDKPANADKKDYKKTHFYINSPELKTSADTIIKHFFPESLSMSQSIPKTLSSDADIAIVLGEDFDRKEFLNNL